jgi:hypothetical protein
VTIVHAGFHKTGTTTIQDFLATHREWLAAQSVHYAPDIEGDLSGHHRLACWLSAPHESQGPNDLFTPEREIYSGMIAARSLEEEVLRSVVSNASAIQLISSEIFDTFDAAELIKLKSFLGFIDRFVLYVRDGIGLLYSCWASKVRWGHTGSFDAFLKGALDFAPGTPIVGALEYVDLLVALFGPERISMRSFNAALRHERGLVGDFVECELNLQAPADVERDRRSNVTISSTVTEAQRALNIWTKDKGFEAGAVARGRFNEALHGAGGKALIDELTQSLVAATKSISIGDMHPTKIGMDGMIAFPKSAAFRNSCEWHFAFDEQTSFVPTDNLVQALDALPSFRRLVETA